MDDPTRFIPLDRLAIAFLPVVGVLCILRLWKQGLTTPVYAVFRMLSQLLLVGYCLSYLFGTEQPAIVMAVLLAMVSIASWISLRTISDQRSKLFWKAFAAVFVAGGLTLLIVTQGVLDLTVWYSPQHVIPLAGMIFSNCMNSVSLAAERYFAEASRSVDHEEARIVALKAALIPITNSMFAVGLVSIPGMMTGLVLNGVAPVIAARYQIMVMCMIYGSSGMSAAIVLQLIGRVRKNVPEFGTE